MSTKDLHSGHRERLRRRFLETGANGFNEHELLELILFYALRRVNTNEIAHRLIDKFGSISAVLEAEKSELVSVQGIGESGALLIKLMFDLCRSYALSVSRQIKFSSSYELEEYISVYFKECDTGACLILSLSMQQELLKVLTIPCDEVLSGEISPRSLAETALRNDLHRIVIARSLPAKPPIPAESDYSFVRILSETLTPLGVEIYDYIIHGCGSTFSMRKSGAFSFNFRIRSEK